MFSYTSPYYITIKKTLKLSYFWWKFLTNLIAADITWWKSRVSDRWSISSRNIKRNQLGLSDSHVNPLLMLNCRGNYISLNDRINLINWLLDSKVNSCSHDYQFYTERLYNDLHAWLELDQDFISRLPLDLYHTGLR